MPALGRVGPSRPEHLRGRSREARQPKTCARPASAGARPVHENQRRFNTSPVPGLVSFSSPFQLTGLLGGDSHRPRTGSLEQMPSSRVHVRGIHFSPPLRRPCCVPWWSLSLGASVCDHAIAGGTRGAAGCSVRMQQVDPPDLKAERTCGAGVPLLGRGWSLDCPRRIRPKWMVDEERPGTV